MNEALVIRSYRAADAVGVRSVMAASYGPNTTPAPIFDWWHFGCPVGVSGFQVAEEKGKIVGLQPMELLPYESAGRRLTGAVLTGVVVHPEFRRRGLFSSLVQACEKEAWRRGADFVTAMPNERSRPGFLKLGCQDLGRRRLLVLPFSGRKLAQRAIRWPGLAAPFAFSLKPALCWSRNWIRSAMTHLEVIKQAPEDLERVNELDQQLFPGLRLVRSASWWNWRYAASPRCYQMLRLPDGQGGTAGLVVTTSEQRKGFEVGYIMDWLVRDAGSVPVLLAGALRQLKAAGVAIAASVVSSKAQIQALSALGFWSVPCWAPAKRFFTVFRPGPTLDPAIAAQLGGIDCWHQTLGDWDNL
jgi:GNAT superfamily N-acetyltransferase